MGNDKRTTLAPLDTTNVHGRTPQGQKSAVVELGDMGDHIKKLKQVSVTAGCLITLLGDQIQVLSRTVPLLRGFEIVRGRSHPIVLALSELLHI